MDAFFSDRPYRFMNARYWPQRARRLFVCLFPISGPLWLAAWPVVLLLHIALIIGVLIAIALRDIWNGPEPPIQYADDEEFG
jgi:hypothetical protein